MKPSDFNADVSAVSGIPAVPTILEVVCRTTGMGFAAVARVTDDRWIACGVRDEIEFGLAPGGELKVETTICNEIRVSREPIVIDHASRDPDFQAHATPTLYRFESYISMPIILPGGEFFGTLCAIDPRPARLKSPEVIGMFRMFADLIGFHLEAHFKVERSEASLADERQQAELREQFIAVLGHDLRNPLASIGSASRLIANEGQGGRISMLVEHIDRSVQRMSSLIADVLDFARGRLGGGVDVDAQWNDALAGELGQIVEELRGANPDRVIESDIDLPRPVRCDLRRVGQVLSNLLANALAHGASDSPVRVRVGCSGKTFELSVANAGKAIPPEVAAELFKPFVRQFSKRRQQGLGLGLYIASEIAKAHGGELRHRSTDGQTVFTFEMPSGV